MWKEDIKKTKISVEGADVEITKVVLRWKGRKDNTVAKVGVVKSGGQTVEKDAPGREATLTSVAVRTRSSIINRRPPSKFGDTTERGVNTGQRTCSRDQRAKGEAIRVHVCWSRARLRRSRPHGHGWRGFGRPKARHPGMIGFDIESIAVQQCQPSGPKRSTCQPTRRQPAVTIPSRGVSITSCRRPARGSHRVADAGARVRSCNRFC